MDEALVLLPFPSSHHHPSPLSAVMSSTSNNTLCPTDNKETIDQSSFWDSNGVNWDAHRIGWAIAGGCAALVRGASIVPEFSHVYLAL